MWAAIVLSLWSHNRTQYSTYIKTVYAQVEGKEVTSALLMKSLKSAVKEIGKEHLSIKADTICTHSIIISLFMFLYINKIDIPTIMLMGRWKSNFFMKYLQTQVK